MIFDLEKSLGGLGDFPPNGVWGNRPQQAQGGLPLAMLAKLQTTGFWGRFNFDIFRKSHFRIYIKKSLYFLFLSLLLKNKK